MPANLLVLLPLVAGYLFYRICYYTRFRAQSLDGYQLLFRCVVVGFAFFTCARAIVIVLKNTIGASLWHMWGIYVSAAPYSGTVTLCVVLAVASALLVNVPIWEAWKRAFVRRRLRAFIRRRLFRHFAPWTPQGRRSLYIHTALWDPDAWQALRSQWQLKKRIALNWATRQQKNQLLILLNEAAETGSIISVTLKNRKYYIGLVKLAPSLDPNETYFRLYPIVSGYRDRDNLQLQKTTDYEPIRAAKATGEPVFVTLPIADVEIANFFDPIAYAQYFVPQVSASDNWTGGLGFAVGDPANESEGSRS